MSEVLKKANEYVQKIELDYVNDLINEYQISCNKAEKCGCNNCKLYKRHVEEQMEDEAIRLSKTWEMDSDEVYLYHLALRMLDEGE